MKLTGAEIVWECLQREGVDVVFGYPGGAILPTYDAIFVHNRDATRRPMPRIRSLQASSMADLATLRAQIAPLCTRLPASDADARRSCDGFLASAA